MPVTFYGSSKQDAWNESGINFAAVVSLRLGLSHQQLILNGKTWLVWTLWCRLLNDVLSSYPTEKRVCKKATC